MPPEPQGRAIARHRRDLVLAGVFALLAACWSAYYSPVAGSTPKDWYFESDHPRVAANTLSRKASNHRAMVHPGFSAVAYGTAAVWREGFGASPEVALRINTGLFAGLLGGLFYLVLRLVGRRRIEAVVFGALFLASAASVFWLVLPETYTLGAVTILAVVGLVAVDERERLGPISYAVGCAATLSMTITNGMVGAIATFLRWPLRRALRIALLGGFLTGCLWLVQLPFFKHTPWPTHLRVERQFLFLPTASRAAEVGAVFLVGAVVMPRVGEVAATEGSQASNLSVQKSPPGSGTALGPLAVVLWLTLLGWGIASVARDRDLRGRRVSQLLLLSLAGQASLHLLYGEETFLYTLHFAPLLVLLASFACAQRGRSVALVGAAMLAVVLALNNVAVFRAVMGAAPESASVSGTDIIGERIEHSSDLGSAFRRRVDRPAHPPQANANRSKPPLAHRAPRAAGSGACSIDVAESSQVLLGLPI